MSNVHKCGFLSSELVFEIERVKEHARNRNRAAASGHLAVVEAALQNFGMYCGFGVMTDEMEHVGDIKKALDGGQFDHVGSMSLELEKKILTRQAEQYNDGGDPEEIIPSRMWDALK